MCRDVGDEQHRAVCAPLSTPSTLINEEQSAQHCDQLSPPSSRSWALAGTVLTIVAGERNNPGGEERENNPGGEEKGE